MDNHEQYDYYEMDMSEYVLVVLILIIWLTSIYYFIKRYNNIII